MVYILLSAIDQSTSDTQFEFFYVSIVRSYSYKITLGGTHMSKNTTTQQFRESATDEKWKELVDDHRKLNSEDFKKKYNFTWSAVVDDAAEKGFYEKKSRVSSDGLKLRDFQVTDQSAEIKKISRSVQIYEDVYSRLKELERGKGQYTHTAILNQLLSDALKMYGM